LTTLPHRLLRNPVESSASAVEWASIFVGALAAFGVTIILLTLGPGLGLATVSPWSLTNQSPTTFGTVAAIWLVITQWLSSAFGGYLAGRLRTKWVGIRTEEVFFRDTEAGLEKSGKEQMGHMEGDEAPERPSGNPEASLRGFDDENVLAPDRSSSLVGKPQSDLLSC
jgi:hypothetical protein